MKQFAIVLALLACLSVACERPMSLESLPQESVENTVVQDITQFPAFTKGMTMAGIKLPDSSRVHVVDEGRSISIAFPEGVYFVRENEAEVPELLREIKYTATCAGNGDCMVMSFGNDFGFLQADCAGTCTGAFVYGENGNNAISLEGGFVDLRQGTSLLRDNNLPNQLFDYHPIVSKIPEVQSGLTMLSLQQLGDLLTEHDSGSSTRVVAANFYGTLVGIHFSESYLATLQDAHLLQEVSCDCETGNTGCILTASPDSPLTLCVASGSSLGTMTLQDAGNPTD